MLAGKDMKRASKRQKYTLKFVFQFSAANTAANNLLGANEANRSNSRIFRKNGHANDEPEKHHTASWSTRYKTHENFAIGNNTL